MKINEIIKPDIKLEEGVTLRDSKEMLAFTIVVAEAYDSAPEYDNNAEKHWVSLRDHTVNTLFPRIKGSGINIQYSEIDPYGDGYGYTEGSDMIRAMLYDMAFNNRLIIYTGHSDHPVFSEKENHIFRTIHDYLTHGTLMKIFKKNFLSVYPNFKEKNKFPTPEMLRKVLPNVSLSKGGNKGFGFNLRGELNATARHIRMAPKSAAPALFSEIVGQACYLTIVGEFPQQKVAILKDFDYINIGKIISGTPTEKRYNELLEKIQNRESPLKLNIKAKPYIQNIEELLIRKST